MTDEPDGLYRYSTMATIEGGYRVQAVEGEEVTLDEVLDAMPGD